MRNLFTFLLLFCFSFLTLAAQDIKNPNGDAEIQGSTDVVYQIISYNTSGKVYRNTYDFTTDFRVRSIIQDTLHNGNWDHINKSIYTTDSINYIYNQTDSVWYENQWHIRNTYTSKYNSTWKLLEYLEELFFDDKLYLAWRTTNTIDSADNLLMSLEEFNKEGKWSNVSRTTYKYDKNKNVLDSLEQNWDNDSWVNYNDYIYTYDERGNKLSSWINFWENNEWVKVCQEIMTYSPTNKLQSYFYGKWDCDKVLLNSYRNTYTYDENGNLLTYLYEYPGHNQWIKYELFSYTYNSNSKIITTLYQKWKNDNWMDSTRDSHIYDLNGNIINVYSQHLENEQWITDHIATFSYNNIGIRLMDERKTWNSQTSLQIFKNIYNDTGKKLSELYEEWEDGKLSNSTRLFFNYDANDNFISGTCEALESGEWVHSNGYFPFVDSRNLYFDGYGYKTEVSYKTITPVKDNIFDANLFLTCSPNPSAGQLNINYTLTEPAITSISISNLFGIEAANISNNQMQLPGSFTIIYDASKLTPGTYFVTIKAGNKAATRKIQINY